MGCFCCPGHRFVRVVFGAAFDSSLISPPRLTFMPTAFARSGLAITSERSSPSARAIESLWIAAEYAWEQVSGLDRRSDPFLNVDPGRSFLAIEQSN